MCATVRIRADTSPSVPSLPLSLPPSLPPDVPEGNASSYPALQPGGTMAARKAVSGEGVNLFETNLRIAAENKVQPAP